MDYKIVFEVEHCPLTAEYLSSIAGSILNKYLREGLGFQTIDTSRYPRKRQISWHYVDSKEAQMLWGILNWLSLHPDKALCLHSVESMPFSELYDLITDSR